VVTFGHCGAAGVTDDLRMRLPGFTIEEVGLLDGVSSKQLGEWATGPDSTEATVVHVDGGRELSLQSAPLLARLPRRARRVVRRAPRRHRLGVCRSPPRDGAALPFHQSFCFVALVRRRGRPYRTSGDHRALAVACRCHAAPLRQRDALGGLPLGISC